MHRFEPSGIVTLLTDFGHTDTYVGQMKGVMLAIEPSLRIVDLTHGVAPQDIVEGAFQLASAIDVFPTGTVHVVVVDPGVGTSRRAVTILAGGHAYVGPDNGVLSCALENAGGAYEITNSDVVRRSVTATFHGRDVFAPAGAHLAAGFPPDELGPEVEHDSLHRLPPAIESIDNGVRAMIVSIDHFGNCITLLKARDIKPAGGRPQIECRGFKVGAISRTFADVLVGQPVAYIGSSGTLELALREGDAAAEFGLRRGDWVTLRY